MKQLISSLLALALVLAMLPMCCAESAKVFLTVSSIDLTLVGDQENIYVGTAPVEAITWSSEDPAIVSVENGVLTAHSVGKTVIHADYEDQHWECKVGCLANSEGGLEALGPEVYDAPKRIPPVTDYDPVPFFSDAAFVGDSISLIFYQNEKVSNQLGHPQYLVRGGTSINGFLKHFKNLSYRGADTHLEDAIQMSGKKKIFIMLGQNDLGYLFVRETLDNYAQLLKAIREKSPDVEIYIQTCSEEYAGAYSNNARNLKIYEFNAKLPEFAKENNCHLVDVAPYLENHRQRLAPIYSLDQEIHVNYDGCLIWGQVLSNFAQLEEIRGGTK